MISELPLPTYKVSSQKWKQYKKIKLLMIVLWWLTYMFRRFNYALNVFELILFQLSAVSLLESFFCEIYIVLSRLICETIYDLLIDRFNEILCYIFQKECPIESLFNFFMPTLPLYWLGISFIFALSLSLNIKIYMD